MTDENAAASESGHTLPAAVRQRLQQSYTVGLKNMESGQFEYATDMLQQCAVGDPSNKVYVQTYLNNLQKKYNNNKKGSKFSGLKGGTAKKAMKKAFTEKDWLGALRAGFEALKPNPWDFATLNMMAEASEQLYFDDCELIYLKAALDGDPKDATINRVCAQALARRGAYDQAISLWHKVEQAKPNNPEAKQAISELQSEKISRRHGPQEGNPTQKTSVAKGGAARRPPRPASMMAAKAKAEQDAAEDATAPKVELTPEQVLRQTISRSPEDLATYLQLSELYVKNREFDKAEETLATAVEVSNGDAIAAVPYEDLRIRRVKSALSAAEKQARETKSPQALEAMKEARTRFNEVELEVYQARADRHPMDTMPKYELAVRLKRVGRIEEAVPMFQESLGEPSIRGLSHLELGECFQHSKQYKAAMESYEAALDNLGEQRVEARKSALYRAGVLATGMKAVEKAVKHLTELVEMDPKYKDAAARLGKLGSGTAGQS